MGRAGRLYVRIKKYDDAVGDDDCDEEDGDDDEDQITWAEPAGFMFGSRNMSRNMMSSSTTSRKNTSRMTKIMMEMIMTISY